jgi:MOSC domain-containing protein YiiM
VHGGPDKAVYAYPSEHLPLWSAELEPEEPFGPGAFGENLTTSGWLETDVRIGDVWSWGGALLQVCQPRYPCFKLAIATGRPDVGKRMLAAGRNGWYLRVLQPGEVPVAGPIAVLERGPVDATVRDAVHALLPGHPRALIERIAAVGSLAGRWREMVLDRLATFDE